MLNIPTLLQPISPEQPCGGDLTYSADMDQIAHARQQDDPALDQGVWVTALKQADWPQVASRCTELIETRSKDLRLAVWLAEALALTQGPRGLGDGFAVLAGLCEQFWEGLFPLGEEGDYDQRIGNLRWLLTRTPAMLQQWQQAQGAVLRADAEYCSGMLLQLERVCDAKLGIEGPSFAAARDALLGMAVHAEEHAVVAPASATQDGMGVVASPGVAGPIHSRQQALSELRRVADYFRATEPHSPVAYLADKAANWGEMSLHSWLREVIKDGSQLSQLEIILGIAASD